jgi:enoyl-CoA hydratase
MGNNEIDLPEWCSNYQHLEFGLDNEGVIHITINRPEHLNAVNGVLHGELGRVWVDVSSDDRVRIAVITGSGRGFSAGGDMDMLVEQAGNYSIIEKRHREAADIVYNMLNCRKIIIAAINGPAVGAGLAVALLADISIIADDAKLTDGHTRIGLGAGDHAAIVWPLLCGMARAKYYLLTADLIDGREAERIGLVSRCVPQGELLETANEIATRLARGPRNATQAVKHNLNNWLRLAGPTFDASLAMEMLDFFSPDVEEGLQAFREKRPPKFA